MTIVDDPKKLESAYTGQYDNLAREFAPILPNKATVAEIGCGKGQLTIPLGQLRPRLRFELVDTFTGPYSGSLGELKLALRHAALKSRVRIHKIDFLDWISDEFSDKYAAVISSEFLSEIDAYELKMFLPQVHRVLRLGGRTIHSFLSPTPRNLRQRLLIEADSNPVWTKTPPTEWFSPRPSLVVSQLRKAGFRSVHVKIVKSSLVVRSIAARAMLKAWDVKSSFWKKHSKQLVKDGLEIPDWIIISGIKK